MVSWLFRWLVGWLLIGSYLVSKVVRNLVTWIVIYLAVILICNRRKEKYRLRRLGLFIGIYLLSTFIIVPLLAPIWG